MVVRLGASLVLLAGLVAGLRSMVNGAPASSLYALVDAAPVAQPDPWLTLLATDPGTAEQDGIDAMMRGLAALRSDRPAAAKTEFVRATGSLPALADWTTLYTAIAAAALGEADTVEALLAGIDPWLARERGWRVRVTALRRSGGTESALPIAHAASIELSLPERRAEAAFEAALIRFTLRDSVGGHAALRYALDEAPSTSVALDAARLLASLPNVSADDHLAIGRLYARHGNATRAVSGIDRFLASGRGTIAERAAVRIEAARALFDVRRYVEAERRLATVANEELPDSLAADARLLIGRAQYRRNQITAGRATLLAVAETYPAERAGAEAAWIVADLDHDAGRLTAAREFYTRVMSSQRAAGAAGDAAIRLGGLLLANGEAGAAAAVFRDYHESVSGERRQQAAFWAGRAHLETGDSANGRRFLHEAFTLDPVSWYGQRAADLLGESTWTGALAPSPATGDAGAMYARAALHRLDLLSSLGLQDAYDIELSRIRDHLASHDAALYAVAEGLHERGQTLTAVLLGRAIKQRAGAWNTRLLRIVYPFPYRDEITAHATRRGLDPFLVAGLIRQESLFDPSARSGAGAIGLMQVRPATGRELARRDGVRPFQTAHLRRPETNVRLGTLYFRDLLARYDGRVGWVLAAYNAGPSRLARWRDLPEAGDPDLFAERIPFRETRDYVKVVQQNARIYRAIYGE